MSQLEKSSHVHQKPIPQEFKEEISYHTEKEDISQQWFQNIGQTFLRIRQVQFKQGISPKHLKANKHPLTALALTILFPNDLTGEMLKIQNMPENTLEEKIDKESAYRSLILQEFSLKEVMTDHINGLRAIISALNPDIDQNSEEITALILRGDIIEHVMKHPEVFHAFHNQENEQDLKKWSTKIAQSEASIGEFEVMAMGQILESPIRIFSFENPNLAFKKPGDFEDSLCLYFDPIRSFYMPMYPLR